MQPSKNDRFDVDEVQFHENVDIADEEFGDALTSFDVSGAQGRDSGITKLMAAGPAVPAAAATSPAAPAAPAPAAAAPAPAAAKAAAPAPAPAAASAKPAATPAPKRGLLARLLAWLKARA